MKFLLFSGTHSASFSICRVPAGTVSAIFEGAGGQSFAGFVYDVKERRLLPLTVFLDTTEVFLSSLSGDLNPEILRAEIYHRGPYTFKEL